MRAHVVYESRLELTRLVYADFDQDVTGVAQPFLLSTIVDGRRRRHVPAFLVMREKDVPLVVDVKPQHRNTRPKVNFVLGWAREDDAVTPAGSAPLKSAVSARHCPSAAPPRGRSEPPDRTVLVGPRRSGSYRVRRARTASARSRSGSVPRPDGNHGVALG
ncbi:hypothetical protein QF026_000055 [Streptomyces aurantiacus]|uniref:hypothetical protein n=1 Tax=Streptomyces aurantiacus TaxID=47760 RepID=UPI002793B025|nr:hypothetical protein [Streptomyces aurantiacus]MDQ0771589.1 hypothetical protein [Streptomyces aurantiacus]